jgi:hypothetical protein
MQTAEQIAGMTPEEAWQELIDYCAYLPLLLVRAQRAGRSSQWLTAGDIAARMQISETAVRMRAATDPAWQVCTSKIGRSWRFRADGFETYEKQALRNRVPRPRRS